MKSSANQQKYDQPCRLCGGRDLRLFYTQGNADEFLFYRCRDCSLVNYNLATGLNQEKYEEFFCDPSDDRLPGNIRRTMIFNALQAIAKPPASVMEVGCGNGRLLYLAQKAGFQVQGLELSPKLAEGVRQRAGIPVEVADFLVYQPPDGKLYDVLVLQHVLEHVPYPVEAMTKIRRLLRPGGRVLLEFPHINGWDLRWKRTVRRWGLHRKNYPPTYRPGHAVEFCRQSFEILAQKTGFRVESWRTYSWKPLTSLIYGILPIGNKARAIAKRID